jgi:hypothetical protein
MKFILYLMLFTTQPAEGPKVESKRVWALQSTSTLEFATQQACYAAGNAVTTSLAGVDTLTVRGWCFCESTDASKKCPKTTTGKSNPAALEPPSDVSIGIQTLRPPNSK